MRSSRAQGHGTGEWSRACEVARLNKGSSREERAGNERREAGGHSSDPTGAQWVTRLLELIVVWAEDDRDSSQDA